MESDNRSNQKLSDSEAVSPAATSRRRFLRATASWLSLAAGASLLAACQPTPPSTPTAPPAGAAPAPATTPPQQAPAAPTPAAAGGPKRGGVLKVGYQTDPLGFDPATSTVWASQLLQELSYSTLLQWDEKMNLQPDLATEWNVSDDHLTYTFKLRPGVKFHNGQELSADDVKFSLERAQQKSPFKYMLQYMERVETPDKLTVRITTNRPDAPFLPFMANVNNSIVPAGAEANGTDLAKSMVGTGPFKLVSYTPKQNAIFERNPDYYDKSLPYVDRLEAVFLPDDTARTNAFQTKVVDLLTVTAPKDFDVLSKTSGVKSLETKGGRWAWLGLNVQHDPLKNPKVRQAIATAVNRKAIADIVFFGHADPIQGGVLPPNSWAYADLKTYPVQGDPEKAKSMLADAGFPGGFPITFTSTSTYNEILQMAVSIKDSLEKAGITVNLDSPEWAVHQTKVWQNHDYDMHDNYWGSPLWDPVDHLDVNYRSDSPANVQGFKDPEVDKLLDQARQTFDQNQRKSLYVDVQKRLAEAVPIVPTVWIPVLSNHWDYVRDVTVLPTGMFKELKRTWLAK